MTDSSPSLDADPLEPARRRGRRVAAGVFFALTAVFIVLSTSQIVTGVFALGATSLASAASAPATGLGCAAAVRALALGVERAMAASTHELDEAQAVARYRAALSPEWDDERAVEARCKAEAHGTDAYAAVLRLRLAGELFVRRQVVELAPIRHDVAAYLPPP